MDNKLKVGIIGLGSMGSTHLDIYSKIKEVEVTAIADSIQSRLDGSSKAEGNISGQAEGGVTGLNATIYLDGSGEMLWSNWMDAHGHVDDFFCFQFLQASGSLRIERCSGSSS